MKKLIILAFLVFASFQVQAIEITMKSLSGKFEVTQSSSPLKMELIIIENGFISIKTEDRQINCLGAGTLVNKDLLFKARCVGGRSLNGKFEFADVEDLDRFTLPFYLEMLGQTVYFDLVRI